MADQAVAGELRERLGRVGIWMGPPARIGIDPAAGAVAVERAGFTSLWIGGGNATPGDLEVIAVMLAATERLIMGTGIANIWAWEPGALRAVADDLSARFPGRFILGLGVSHRPLVAALGHAYERPFAKMAKFLTELDHPAQHGAEGKLPPVVLAALGPRMLGLSGSRTAGAHPYFTPPAHTASARFILGRAPLLIPELAGALAPGEAGLAAVRPYAQRYLSMPNYAGNLRRLGFTEDDVAGTGSARLLSAVTPHGAPQVLARVREHLDAGADHVVIQPLAEGGGFALGDLAELASLVAELPK